MPKLDLYFKIEWTGSGWRYFCLGKWSRDTYLSQTEAYKALKCLLEPLIVRTCSNCKELTDTNLTIYYVFSQESRKGIVKRLCRECEPMFENKRIK